MLMLFPTIKVPGLDDIEIFRDNEDTTLFYALRGRPKIAIDEQGTPQLSFNFFSRNADIAYASSTNKDLIESQLGQLLFTTDLSVTKEEHETIVTYLEGILGNSNDRFVTIYHKFLRRPILTTVGTKPIIKLGTPNTWKEGTARLEILEGLGDTFKKQSSAEVKPALIGSNSASFYATFGIEGAQIYYDALTKGHSGEGDQITPLQAIVRYDLTGYAFVPNLEIRVTANSSQIFTKMESFQADYVKNRRGTLKIETSLFSRKVTDSRSVYASKTDIAKLVEQMIDSKVINIEITDFGDVAANSQEIKDIETNLRTSLMDMIMNTIIPNFFKTAFEGSSDTQGDGSTTPTATVAPSPSTGISASEMDRPNVESHYLFKNNVDKTKITSLDFHFKKNGTVEFRRYPNGTLITNLNETQLKSLVKHIDISSPEVQVLTVQVGVNADFTNDNIHSIIVNIKYSQRDHKTNVVRENSKSFLYKIGDEINTFRVTMARNEKGQLLDFYKIEAKISYKGTAESPPPIVLENVSDRSLVVSYDKLGFISVNCIAGDIDWTIIKEVIVNLEYPSASSQSDTKKEIRLLQDSPNGSWRCFMHGNKAKDYTYQVRYILHDGQENLGEIKSDTRDTLLIDDLLTGRAKASFDVIIDTNTVKTAKVEILYEDTKLGVKEEFSKWFSNTETWDWAMRLRQGGVDVFKYRYFVEYADNIVYTSPWAEARTDEDIPPIHLRRYPKSLTIDGGLLDWNAYKVVYVSVKYFDEGKNYLKQENIRLDSNSFLTSFDILAFDPEAKAFKYSLKFAKSDGAQVTVDEEENNSGLLILNAPQ